MSVGGDETTARAPGGDEPPPLRLLCNMSVRFEDVQFAGGPYGTRITAIVAGGRLEGPELCGDVLPGGGDWILVGSDGVARLDVRVTIRTDDGALVHTTYGGRVSMPDAVRDRYLAGETVRGDEMYGRSAPMFEADPGTHGWLNAVVAVGAITELSQRHIAYRFWRVG